MMYGEPDAMEDEEGNEKRPGIRRHGAPEEGSAAEQNHFSRQPSTYPPIQGRPPGGIASGTFPPRSNYSGSGSSSTPVPQTAAMPHPHPTSSASSSLYPPGQGPPVFAQSTMTESPKPLSPGSTQTRQPGHPEASLHRNRSPSLTSHFHQQQFGRGSGGRTPPSAMNMPPGAPQLPPPHSLNPPDPRYTLPSQGGPAHPPTQPSGPPTHMSGSGPLSSHSNSLSSHGHSAQGSGENAAALFGQQKEDRLWAYVKSLEQRMNSLQDEVNGLRAQLAAATQPQQR